MADADRVPGRAWYWLAGVVAFTTLAAVAAAGTWMYLQVSRAEQFLAPGRHVLELARPGSYLVWNDYRTVYQGRSYDESKQLPRGARITVIEKASGRELAVGSYSGTSSSTGTSESLTVAQFPVERPGAYEIVIEGEFPPRVFSVGRNFIWQLVGGIFGAISVLFVGFGTALAISGWAFLVRSQARDATARAGAAGLATADAREASLKQLTAIVYGLQLVGFFVGLTLIAGVVINILKRHEVEGTWLESHFRWQIRTFWFAFAWSLLGFALLFVLVGILILMATGAWLVYRAVRGWVALEDGKPMYAA